MTTTIKHNSDKRVVRTKKAIKNALFQLMENKDISLITISELTVAANVNRRTFYTHYRCTNDILTEIEKDFVDAIGCLMDQFDTRDFEKSSYSLFMSLYDLVNGEYSYHFKLLRIDMRGALLHRLKTMLKESQKKILSRINPDAEMDKQRELVYSFICGGFLCTFLEWFNEENRVSPHEAALVASKMVLACADSIAAQKKADDKIKTQEAANKPEMLIAE